LCQAGKHSSLHRLSDFFINGRLHLVVASKLNDSDDAKNSFLEYINSIFLLMPLCEIPASIAVVHKEHK